MKTEELTDLENMLDGELKCQSSHREENKYCSQKVTHKVFDCDRSPAVCANSYIWISSWMSYAICGDCDRPASECWRIIPI